MTQLRHWIGGVTFSAALLPPVPLLAQAPASVTAICEDGALFGPTSRLGACRGDDEMQASTTAATSGSVSLSPPQSRYRERHGHALGVHKSHQP